MEVIRMYIFPLLGVVIGFLLNELSFWFRTAREDKKIKRKVLYNLLETHHIIAKLDSSELTKIVKGRILIRISKEQKEEAEQFLNKLFGELLENELRKMVVEDLKAIEDDFSKTVDELATLDPLTAYRLRGKTKMMQVFEFLQDYYNKVEEKLPSEDKQKTTDHIEMINDFLKPKMIREAIINLSGEIRVIAFSVDFWTWMNVTTTLAKSKKVKYKETEMQIDALLDEFITSHD